MEPRPPIPVARLAVEIADEAARSDIESFCDIPSGELHGWYSTAPRASRDPYETKCIERAVRYLTMRRMLRVKTPHLVKIKST